MNFDRNFYLFSCSVNYIFHNVAKNDVIKAKF